MRKIKILLCSVVCLWVVLIQPGVPLSAERLRLASTTSTENSGFFDYILPMFEKKTGISVHVVAVGTGAAIELGKRGDADAVLVHAKQMELQAVKEGWFVDRREVMYNAFLIVGPKDDPAGVRKAKTAAEAMKKIVEAGQPFVSRGDNSGTHEKEKELWSKAGLTPAALKDNYAEVGQGMNKTLQIASQKGAYTLTDSATYFSLRDELALVALFEADPALMNQYSVIAVNPARHRHANYRAAKKFTDWLVSDEGQWAIVNCMDKKGFQLFIPNAR